MASNDLKPGDKAPDFTLPADGNGTISLAQLKGKSVVLYFYPKDDTSGCTAEAIAFTKDSKAFKAAGAVILGISKDSAKSHDKFKAKYDLNLTLASDQSGAAVEGLGAWVEKSMYGRKYMGIDRSTFLIGPDGVIRRIWRKVKITGHVDEVLKAAQAS